MMLNNQRRSRIAMILKQSIGHNNFKINKRGPDMCFKIKRSLFVCLTHSIKNKHAFNKTTKIEQLNQIDSICWGQFFFMLVLHSGLLNTRCCTNSYTLRNYCTYVSDSTTQSHNTCLWTLSSLYAGATIFILITKAQPLRGPMPGFDPPFD